MKNENEEQMSDLECVRAIARKMVNLIERTIPKELPVINATSDKEKKRMVDELLAQRNSMLRALDTLAKLFARLDKHEAEMKAKAGGLGLGIPPGL